jgi:hypothetical protein
MKTEAQRAAKRRKREARDEKGSTWNCSGCGKRHPHGSRCPIPRRDPFADTFGGLELGVLAALAAADRMMKKR